MSENSSKNPVKASVGSKKPSRWMLLALPLWALASFYIAQFILVGVIYVLRMAGVPVEELNATVFNTVIAAAVYVISVLLVIGVPVLVWKRRTTRKEVGMQRLPTWLDLGLTPVVYVSYLILSGLLVYVVTKLMPDFDVTQAQSIGFSDLTQRYEYILAFITLVLIAPAAEETLFRGYLQGKLRGVTSFWLTALITSVVFAALHLPGDGALQWNVAVDVFILSIALCFLRERTGSIWAGVLLHMMKNGIAFYFLFINPSIISTIGG